MFLSKTCLFFIVFLADKVVAYVLLHRDVFHYKLEIQTHN